mmetsp:Transcript_17691/g.57220  ORF Transcript_17691/g.57220 Transcript_17691/m.57220 type:complete len:89 (-) Transcript_17691:165-431(-)
MGISGVSPWLEMTFNALATGTFLYVGATEVVSDELDKDVMGAGARAEECAHHEDHKTAGRFAKFAFFLCGSLVIALANIVPEGEGHDH